MLTSCDLPEHVLSQQFWVHFEYMPRPDIDISSTTKTLLASLGTLAIGTVQLSMRLNMCAALQKLVDASTSTGSVSPFHPDECKSYSRELKQVLEVGITLDINWCTGKPVSFKDSYVHAVIEISSQDYEPTK
jgi:hypothetical protein